MVVDILVVFFVQVFIVLLMVLFFGNKITNFIQSNFRKRKDCVLSLLGLVGLLISVFVLMWIMHYMLELPKTVETLKELPLIQTDNYKITEITTEKIIAENTNIDIKDDLYELVVSNEPKLEIQYKAKDLELLGGNVLVRSILKQKTVYVNEDIYGLISAFRNEMIYEVNK